MKKINIKMVAGLFALAGALSGIVHGASTLRFPEDPPVGAGATKNGEGCYSTCGGEIPWPFQVSNQAVELSDGERYLLLGKVVIEGGRAYFEVDLTKHAWLATTKRRQNPRYVLEGSPDYWAAYQGKRVRLVSTAQWAVVQDVGNHELKVEVVLQSLADPAVTSDAAPQPAPAESRPQGLR